MKSAWLVVAFVPVFVCAQNTVQKPALGSILRKAILDGLRPSIEKDLKQKVIFKVDMMRVYKGWAFVHVHPIQPNGKIIDFKKTHYREDLEQGGFDGDSTYALLKLSGSKWRVKTFAIGPTDVVWSNWMDSPYYAPKALFPNPFGGG